MDDSNKVRRVACPMENVSATFQSLDTVRALHQTVVSLRSALEEAKKEIQRLRSQISVQSNIKEGAKQKQVGHILKEQSEIKNIENPLDISPVDDVAVETTPEGFDTDETPKDIPVYTETTEVIELSKETNIVPALFLETPIADTISHSLSKKTESRSRITFIPDISITAHPRTDGRSKKMTSKIDVKIKVMSNINVEGSGSGTSSDSQPSSAHSSKDEDNTKKDFEDEESEKLSEDRLSGSKEDPGTKDVVENFTKDIVTLKDDNSASDSENSVFFEDKQKVTSSTPDTKERKITDEKVHESKEEVDDIELIFSSGENRDPIQEDLVSISEYDPWQAVGSSGTPVLVKFSSLHSDQEYVPSGKKLPVSVSHDVFFDPNSLSQQKSLESTESFDDQRSTKSSSLERDTSDDAKDNLQSIGRDESLDFFDQRDSSIGRKWTNYNVLVETDISKCGIIEETTYEMYRRNTCPNPPAYRPLMQRESILTTRHVSSKLGTKYSRRFGQGIAGSSQSTRPIILEKGGAKRSSAAQTEISALPDHWKSESQLTEGQLQIGGPFTLPSKFTPGVTMGGCHKHAIRSCDRTQEARRVLLSDINFTSMVPELSRSADHLCPDKGVQNSSNQSAHYYKGSHLKTPDYAIKGITPSVSMTSPGVSQWTVNENSFGTQTIQTGESWGKRGDSFDSCRSYSVDSRQSGLNRYHRSRSVPSVRCAVCKLAHGIRTSESMHYTPRVTFQDPACKIRGSLPDLRYDCMCSKRNPTRSIFTIHGDSGGSTESLLDEADTFVRKSMEGANILEDENSKRSNLRRMSENDVHRDYTPSKQSLPFLPKTAKCLKPGHLAKVIAKNGRVVVGRVRYVGPLVTFDKSGGNVIDELFVGIQLQSKCGDCDGTFDGRKFFDCEPLQGLFVPFKKVVMAWTA